MIGHGVDIIEVSRVRQMLERHADRALERCFTPGEQAYAEGKKRRDEHLAARFAAKEAVMKALGTGWTNGVTWTDIDVYVEESGRPRVRLTGRALEIASQLGISAWHLSLSHTETTAIASVIAE